MKWRGKKKQPSQVSCKIDIGSSSIIIKINKLNHSFFIFKNEMILLWFVFVFDLRRNKLPTIIAIIIKAQHNTDKSIITNVIVESFSICD